MSILFVNGSPNKVGNTAKLAEQFLRGKEYKTLNLTDYKVYSFGQKFEDDQFAEVIAEIQNNDTIVFGSPLYWHNICGALRNVLDRTYGYLEPSAFAGKKMFFIFQGAAPEILRKVADTCNIIKCNPRELDRNEIYEILLECL